MQPTFIRRFTFRNLEANPATFARLVAGPGSDSPLWDQRPFADRFTLREILAHLADLDEIVLGRLERILKEDTPALPNWDEGAAVLENNYAAAVPITQLARLEASRNRMVSFLRDRAPEELARRATHPMLGEYSMLDASVLLLNHDLYHFQQIVEWRSILDSLAHGNDTTR